MYYSYNKNLSAQARLLRINMTAEEKHLWYDFLKGFPVTVHRQKNIGNYIVDFLIASKNIVIEIDGSQHGEKEHREADLKRDREMQKLGFAVLRYTNEDVRENFRGVCEDILKKSGFM